MDNDTLTKLHTVNLTNLRSVARIVGVSRPTTLNRKDLLAEIVSVVDGKKRPITVTKQGQPVKRSVLPTDLLKLAEALRMTAEQNAELRNASVRPVRMGDVDMGDLGDFFHPKTIQGYFYRDLSGHAGVFNEDFECMIELENPPVIENGTPVAIAAKGKPNVEAIDYLEPAGYELPRPWREEAVGSGRTLHIGGIPVKEGGVTVVAGENADAVVSEIAARLEADAVWAIGFAGELPTGWDVSKEGIRIGLASREDVDYIRFVAARAMRCAEHGERVLLAAVGEFREEIWRDACGVLGNGGSVTLTYLTDRETPCDTRIETSGMDEYYPPIDYTLSVCMFSAGKTDEEYRRLKAAAEGKTAQEAWVSVCRANG